MGWECQLANGKTIITWAVSADSIGEGAVNGNGGNFGNGWAWQTLKLFRERHPDVLIELANFGMSSQSTSTYNPVIVERLPALSQTC